VSHLWPSARICGAEREHFSLSLWYPRYMLQARIAYFFGAASMAGAFSGLLAYAIGFMGGIGGLQGWSWIFVSPNLHKREKDV